MATICADCGHTTTSYTIRFRAGKMISTCKVCEHPPVSDQRVTSMFADLTLDHVTGEDGRPLRVTSLRQLREAEKKYHFRSVVANEDEANFDKPPQTESRSLADVMFAENKWLYPDVARSMLKEMERNGELSR